MNEATLDKLKSMLISHHRDRLSKIKKIKKMVNRIMETEMLITRYHLSCWKKAPELSQFDLDLIQIKALVAKKKQRFNSMSSS